MVGQTFVTFTCPFSGRWLSIHLCAATTTWQHAPRVLEESSFTRHALHANSIQKLHTAYGFVDAFTAARYYKRFSTHAGGLVSRTKTFICTFTTSRDSLPFLPLPLPAVYLLACAKPSSRTCSSTFWMFGRMLSLPRKKRCLDRFLSLLPPTCLIYGRLPPPATTARRLYRALPVPCHSWFLVLPCCSLCLFCRTYSLPTYLHSAFRRRTFTYTYIALLLFLHTRSAYLTFSAVTFTSPGRWMFLRCTAHHTHLPPYPDVCHADFLGRTHIVALPGFVYARSLQ